jgi:outer membrane protein
MLRRLTFTILLLGAVPAHAQTLCQVDFQKAVTETNEGKSAQTKIDTMYSARQSELKRMEDELTKAITDFQGRAMILSETARAEEEQKLALKQRNFEQTYMQYQQEMQQTYMQMLGDLDEKMRKVAADVGKAQGCEVVLDNAVVVYAGASIKDVTSALVTKYNSAHPQQ